MRYCIRLEKSNSFINYIDKLGNTYSYLIVFYDILSDHYNPNNCLVYAILGQHGGASLDYVKRLTKPNLNSKQGKKLKSIVNAELKRLGYKDMILTDNIPKNARKVRLKTLLRRY